MVFLVIFSQGLKCHRESLHLLLKVGDDLVDGVFGSTAVRFVLFPLGRRVAVCAPTTRGLCRYHGCWVAFSSAGATVGATGVVSGGLGAGAAPLRYLPCGSFRHCPGAVPPGLCLCMFRA